MKADHRLVTLHRDRLIAYCMIRSSSLGELESHLHLADRTLIALARKFVRCHEQVASGESCRLLSSTPFRSSSGECWIKGSTWEVVIAKGTRTKSSRKVTTRAKRSKAPAARKGGGKSGGRSVHDARFPNEDRRYRAARDTLLKAEVDLRREVERVAALRRKLPLGGTARDYEFEERTGAETRTIKLSELFGDKDTLVIYSYMFGPHMKAPCPSCTSILDSLDGTAPHVMQRAALAVVAKSPIARIRAFTDQRGWRNLRLLSSASNSYNRDYHGETEDGAQRPILNVFVRKDGAIYHAYATELLFAPTEKGQNGRHVDMIWPLWNMLDYTPEGRGKDWSPKLSYAD